MDQFHWDGGRRVCASARAADDAGVADRALGFMASHLYTCKIGCPPSDLSLSAFHAWARPVGGFTLARFRSEAAGASLLRREAAEISRDKHDRYVLYAQLRGTAAVSQLGRSQVLEQGRYTLVCSSEPTTQGTSGGGDTICLAIPRAYVDSRVASGGERICLHAHDASTGLHKLVFDTVNTLQETAADIGDEDFERSVRIIADLALVALCGSTNVASQERSVRSASLARVKTVIRRRLTNPDLTLADVAREAGLSLCYLHELFRDDGEGVTMRQYLQRERLQRARDLLALSSARAKTITDVAMASGFSSISHFSRSFKSAFGLSPREVLRAR